MSDSLPGASAPHARALPFPDMAKFSGEAAAAVVLEVTHYADELCARARRLSPGDGVLRAHVDTAIAQMRPKSGVERLRVASDWAKQLGFLSLGLAITQYQIVVGAPALAARDLRVLLSELVAAAVLVTVGLVLDHRTISRPR